MHTHHRRTDGFTMIELMIVVAVVGILAAIAIPSYHSYTVRSKVTECLNMASPARIAVSETAAGTEPASYEFLSTRYCEDVQIADGGVIVMETQDTGAATSPVLQLVPVPVGGSGQVRWDCELVAGRAAHVPAHCRTPGVRATAIVAQSAPGTGSSADESSSAGTGTGTGTGAGAGAGADPSGTGSSSDAGSGSAGSDYSDPGSADSGHTGGSAGDASSAGEGESGGGATADGETGGGSTGSSATGDGATGGGATGDGATGGGSTGGGSTGGGATGDGATGGGAMGDAEAEDDAPECEHRLPNGRPHPSRCPPGSR